MPNNKRRTVKSVETENVRITFPAGGIGSNEVGCVQLPPGLTDEGQRLVLEGLQKLVDSGAIQVDDKYKRAR